MKAVVQKILNKREHLFLFTITCLILLIRIFGNKKEREIKIFENINNIFNLSKSKSHGVDYKYSHPLEIEVCHLPYSIHADYEMRYFYESRQNFACPPSKYPSLVFQDIDGKIHFNSSNDIQFKCFYRLLTGTLHPNQNLVKFEDEWNSLNDGMEVDADQFAVKCVNTRKNETIFIDAFANVSNKSHISSNLDKNKLNVIWLILDSVSNGQFQRHMPKTMEFLNERDAAVLNGYSIVSYKEEINMMAMLGGKVHDAEENGFKIHPLFFVTNSKLENFQKNLDDELGSIVTQAKNFGYMTMYNEDIIKKDSGIFHSENLFGYSKPPSHYYYRPFYQFLYSNFENDQSNICLNGKLTGHRTLDLMQRFSSKYRDTPHLSFNFVGTAHYNPNDLSLLDDKLFETLKSLEENGVLSKSLFILTSNHGQWSHPIHNTFHGRVEERNPVASILLPEKYKTKYPDDFKNLKINENRLTSHFDLHETISGLIKPNTSTIGVGRTLFREKPITLSCHYSKIPMYVCPCWHNSNPEYVVNDYNKDLLWNSIFVPIEKQLDSFTCLNKYTLDYPKNIQFFSLWPTGRLGIRDVPTYKSNLNEDVFNRQNRDKTTFNEYFDVEARFSLNAIAKNTNFNFNINARIKYNTVTEGIQEIIKPRIQIENCAENLLENLCNCF